MYSATFIFDKKQYDEAFYKLDQAIAEIARNSAGYLGEEAWDFATISPAFIFLNRTPIALHAISATHSAHELIDTAFK